VALDLGQAPLPPMPWFDVARLSDRDLKAYLKSIKPIQNPVPWLGTF